jgi:hypothetical protein
MAMLIILGHALMQTFVNLLRLVTRRYNLTSLLINNAVKVDASPQSAFSGTKFKPSLGTAWSFCADTCVFMHRSVEESLITVEVIRSRGGVFVIFVAMAN